MAPRRVSQARYANFSAPAGLLGGRFSAPIQRLPRSV